MAYLRTHPNKSRFWFLRYRDSDTGKWREESLRLLIDDERQTREAQKKADKRTADETRGGTDRRGLWRHWVPPFIEEHYRSENTAKRARAAWGRVSDWLRLRKLEHPRQIRYEHAADYLSWRTTQPPEPTQRGRQFTPASHNTALHEIKFLAFLLNQAIRLEHAERNVLARLGVGRDAPAEKPELTDSDVAKARKAFANEAKWMAVVFEIQLYTGCRFSEASIPLDRVDFDGALLVLEDAKRDATDPRKRFRVPLHPHLRPVLWKLREQARTVPRCTDEMNFRFNRVLKKATGATSHSLRVTFITRAHRAGLSEREAMRLVNHSSRLVHAIYSRLNGEDLRQAQAKIGLPPPA